MQGGSGGTPPENFEVLHALKCVLGASEAPVCACIQYIHIPASCRLRLAVSERESLYSPMLKYESYRSRGLKLRHRVTMRKERLSTLQFNAAAPRLFVCHLIKYS